MSMMGGAATINIVYAPAFSAASLSESQRFMRAIVPELQRELRRQGVRVPESQGLVSRQGVR